MPTAVDIDELRALVADALEAELEDVGDQANFADELEMDSLVLLEISAQLESRYGIAIDNADLAGVQSLVDLHAFVKARCDAGSAG
jgi:acyl carrier protein